MNRITLCLGSLAIAGCFDASPSSDGAGTPLTKEDARAQYADGRVDAASRDLCDEEGWYGDGTCDDFCPETDADCGTRMCHDRNDPDVRYVFDSVSACAAGLYMCNADEVGFLDDCGCGCLKNEAPAPQCHDRNDPNVRYIGDSAAQCAVALFQCNAGETGFTDECGCGCVKAPTTRECRDRDDPNVRYVLDSPQSCQVALIACEAGTQYFYDDCGCGCVATPTGPSDDVVCGGLRGAQCPAGTFCRYEVDAICGAADATGVCAARPGGCTAHYDPVCGCDGRTYGNECAANAAGVSAASRGACR